jgi:hypothetical protein
MHLGAPLHRVEAPDAGHEVGSIGVGEKFALERVPHARNDQRPPIGFESAAAVFDRPADKLGLDAGAVRHSGRGATREAPVAQDLLYADPAEQVEIAVRSAEPIHHRLSG